jgi:hypothetical protein
LISGSFPGCRQSGAEHTASTEHDIILFRYRSSSNLKGNPASGKYFLKQDLLIQRCAGTTKKVRTSACLVAGEGQNAAGAQNKITFYKGL